MSLENPTFIEKVVANWKAVLIAFGIFVALLLIAFIWGSSKGREWADSKYLEEREKRIGQIAVLQDNEQKLAVENEKLRAQNEAQAEILTKNDAILAGDAKKFLELQKEREKKQNEIEDASDVDTILGVCNDAKRSGFDLSFCK